MNTKVDQSYQLIHYYLLSERFQTIIKCALWSRMSTGLRTYSATFNCVNLSKFLTSLLLSFFPKDYKILLSEVL